MKIAIANATDHLSGGVEAYIDLLIPALLANGHELLFVHERSGDPSRPRILALDRIEHVSIGDAGTDASFRRVAAWQPDVIFAQTFVDAANEDAALAVAPTVLFAHAYYGTCISGSKSFRLPVARPCSRSFGPACLLMYYPRRCGGLDPRRMRMEYLRQRRRHQGLHRYAAVVTFSEHMRDEYVRNGMAHDRVMRLPPVSPAWAATREPGGDPLANMRDGCDVHLAFVGRIERLKGLHLFLGAVPRLDVKGRIKVTIAGDGRDLDRCRSIANRIQAERPAIVIDFIGWVSEARAAEVIRQCDVLVMPSIWPEPFGFAGADAVRAGTPVAAFDVGAVREWLSDGVTGSVAPADPPNAAGLAHAIERCLVLNAERPCRVTREATDADACLDRHVTALVGLLEQASRRVHDSP